MISSLISFACTPIPLYPVHQGLLGLNLILAGRRLTLKKTNIVPTVYMMDVLSDRQN